MKYMLSIFLFIFSTVSYGLTECNVHFYPTIFYFEKTEDPSSDYFFKKTDCPADVQQKIIKAIYSYDSNLKAKYVEKILSEEIPHYKIKILPDQFKFVEFKNFLQNHLILSKDQVIIKTNLLNNSPFLKLDDEQKIKFTCEDCHFLGHKNIKISIYNSNTGISINEWVNAEVAIKTKVLISTKNINPSNRGFLENDFREDYIYATKPEIYFSSLNEIQFYRPTQSLAEGNVLKNNDIIPFDIVKYGHPTTILFEKDGISLSGTAIPVKNAKYNEIVKLQRQNKTYVSGRVINFNQVKVDL